MFSVALYGLNKKSTKRQTPLHCTVFTSNTLKHNRLCRESTQPVVMIAVADL